MSWQSKTEQVILQDLLDQIQESREISSEFSQPINQQVGGLGVIGQGQPSGAFGASSGSMSFHPINVLITDVDQGGTATGVFDKIDVRGQFMIVDAVGALDVRFIQRASNNGQRIYLMPKIGKVLTLKTGGDIDIGADITVNDNQIIELIFGDENISNITADGGWIITGIGAGGGGINFPILYPEENLGNVGNQTVNINLNQANGHSKEMTLTADIGLAFTNPPPATNGFEFHLMFIQDATGSHSITSTPSALKNASSLDGLLDKTANAKTVFKFWTTDGGVSFHGELVDLTTSGVSSLNDLSDVTITSAQLADILQHDGTRFVNRQFIRTNAATVPPVGLIRVGNDQIAVALSSAVGGGQIEIKSDPTIGGRIDITDSGNQTLSIQIRAQHAVQPDQILLIQQNSGTGGTSNITFPNFLNLLHSANGIQIQLDGSTIFLFNDLDMQNNSIRNANDLDIVRDDGTARMSIIGGVGAAGDVRMDMITGVDLIISEALTDKFIFDVVNEIFQIEGGTGPSLSLVESGGLNQFIITKTGAQTTINDQAGDPLKLQIAGTTVIDITSTLVTYFQDLFMNRFSIIDTDALSFKNSAGNARGTFSALIANELELDLLTNEAFIIKEAGTPVITLDPTNDILLMEGATDFAIQLRELVGSKTGQFTKFATNLDISDPDQLNLSIAFTNKLRIEPTLITAFEDINMSTKDITNATIIAATTITATSILNANTVLNFGGVDADQHNMIGFLTIFDRTNAMANPAAGSLHLFMDSATGELSVKKSGGGTVSLEAGGGGGPPFNDNQVIIQDEVDNTKTLTFNLSLVNPSAANLLSWAVGGGRTHTFSATSGTLAQLNLAQTWTALQTFGNSASEFIRMTSGAKLEFENASVNNLEIHAEDNMFDPGDFGIATRSGLEIDINPGLNTVFHIGDSQFDPWILVDETTLSLGGTPATAEDGYDIFMRNLAALNVPGSGSIVNIIGTARTGALDSSYFDYAEVELGSFVMSATANLNRGNMKLQVTSFDIMTTGMEMRGLGGSAQVMLGFYGSTPTSQASVAKVVSGEALSLTQDKIALLQDALDALGLVLTF